MKLFNSGYILNNKRFGWIDYDRGISIILVSYRHCFETLTNSGVNLKAFPFFEYLNVFLFGFRMPLFFIASGIFVSSSINKKGLGAYAKNRVQNILYPLLVWGSIQITLQILFSAYTNSNIHPISYLYLLINPREIAQFWYLNALFCVGIIYSFLKVKLKVNVNHQLILGLVLYFLLAYIRTKSWNIGFGTDICEFYIFFAIGDAISGFILSDKTVNIFTSHWFILLLFPLFLLIQYFFTKINLTQGDNYFVEHNMPLFFLLVALVGCTISICISFLLKKMQTFSFLRVIGYNSVHIYCMGIIVMSVTRLILMKIMGITQVPLLVALVLISGVLVPMIIYNICLRFNMWWMFSLKKPIGEIEYLANKKSPKI